MTRLFIPAMNSLVPDSARVRSLSVIDGAFFLNVNKGGEVGTRPGPERQVAPQGRVAGGARADGLAQVDGLFLSFFCRGEAR